MTTTKSHFIRTYADSLTVLEMADQLGCAPSYVRRVIAGRISRVRVEYVACDAALPKKREKACVRMRRLASVAHHN